MKTELTDCLHTSGTYVTKEQNKVNTRHCVACNEVLDTVSDDELKEIEDRIEKEYKAMLENENLKPFEEFLGGK